MAANIYLLVVLISLIPLASAGAPNVTKIEPAEGPVFGNTSMLTINDIICNMNVDTRVQT